MEKVRPVILVICDYYLPGFESGGAMRTIVNMVDRLSDSYEFKIITRDHDGPLNREPYRNVRIGDWNRVGGADVFYLSKGSIRSAVIKKLVDQINPAAIYLNSFFSPLTIFTLYLRRFGRIKNIPIVLAPEGELVPGALSIKPLKKRLYLRAAKLLHLLDNVVWKSASEFERDNIKIIFGLDREVFIAPNMPPRIILPDFDLTAKPAKRPGAAKMVFLSRFMRKKNFKWLLEMLPGIEGDLTIDIYGPVEDESYRQECQQIIKTLPDGIRIDGRGAVPHDAVAKTLAKYHFFVLPTLGENFGHIFIEALSAGCPLLISDRTPWRNLEKEEIGWDIPLETPEKWLAAINCCLEMDNDDYQTMSKKARDFAVEWLTDPGLENANRAVLDLAVGSV